MVCPLVGDVPPFFAVAPAFTPLAPGLAAVVLGFFVPCTGLAVALAADLCVVVLGAVFAAGDAFFGGIFLLNESYTLWWTQTDPNKALFTFHKDSNFGATSAILVTTRMLVPSTARSVSSIDFFSSDRSRCRKVAPE